MQILTCTCSNNFAITFFPELAFNSAPTYLYRLHPWFLEAQLTEENPVAEIYNRKKAKSNGQEY